MAICARSAASRRRALAKLGAVAASATEHDDVKTVKPAVAAASCAVADAAASPSFASARRREAVDRAQIAITAH